MTIKDNTIYAITGGIAEGDTKFANSILWHGVSENNIGAPGSLVHAAGTLYRSIAIRRGR